jgi:histidinol-phosphate aminotransferase
VQAAPYQSYVDLTDVHARLHLNELPYGLPPELMDAAIEELRHANRYPDPDAQCSKQSLSRYLSIDPACLIVGNGCDELILLAILCLARGGHVLTTAQTYPGYQAAAKLASIDFRDVQLTDWHVSVDELLEGLTPGTKVAVLCNPHNPCGTYLPQHEIRRFVTGCNTKNVIPVLDEAYIDFAPRESADSIDLIRAGADVLVLRTFSKAFGMAGLRVGFAVGSSAIVSRLQNGAEAIPFRVNRIAQRLVSEICVRPRLLEERIDKIVQRRTRFEALLERDRVWHLPSNGNFVFMSAAEGLSIDVARAQGIVVRGCASMGFPNHWRVAIGNTSEMFRFSEWLRHERKKD